MKITEIKWEQGKTYRAGVSQYYVDGGDLIRKLEGVFDEDITDILSMETILKLDFEEVIQPVDFVTAFKDCEETGQGYKTPTQVMRKNEDSELVVIRSEYGYTNVICCGEWVKYD
jgi:hypothetical protein